jgi:hypothetical protein
MQTARRYDLILADVLPAVASDLRLARPFNHPHVLLLPVTVNPKGQVGALLRVLPQRSRQAALHRGSWGPPPGLNVE